jgi:alkaline phosphatase D
VPVVDPADPEAVTYRTFRPNKLLQIWLVENRDYRSPNRSPDGPEKTIWGARQRQWLKRTLLESGAAVKVLISPTPMVGPDDSYKKDNHTNLGGFRHEGTAFFEWAKENGFLEKGLYFTCGDRHWQYHAIHPSGFEEFSCGALVDANSRMGVPPGGKKSTDPEAKIKHVYRSKEPSGGFLNVVVEPGADAKTAAAHFNFYDENGVLLYSASKTVPVDD